MKSIIAKIVLVLAIVTIFGVEGHSAKAAYCTKALKNCWSDCEGTIFVGGCQTGCNIGYLFC